MDDGRRHSTPSVSYRSYFYRSYFYRSYFYRSYFYRSGFYRRSPVGMEVAAETARPVREARLGPALSPRMEST
jgi:hypothetical protein